MDGTSEVSGVTGVWQNLPTSLVDQTLKERRGQAASLCRLTDDHGRKLLVVPDDSYLR